MQVARNVKKLVHNMPVEYKTSHLRL